MAGTPSRAARRIMTDDGFNVGILYRGKRRAYDLHVEDEFGDLVFGFFSVLF